jgi:hypothetical protein
VTTNSKPRRKTKTEYEAIRAEKRRRFANTSYDITLRLRRFRRPEGFCNETRLSRLALSDAKTRTAKAVPKVKKFDDAYIKELEKDLIEYKIPKKIRDMITGYAKGIPPAVDNPEASYECWRFENMRRNPSIYFGSQ